MRTLDSRVRDNLDTALDENGYDMRNLPVEEVAEDLLTRADYDFDDDYIHLDEDDLFRQVCEAVARWQESRK